MNAKIEMKETGSRIRWLRNTAGLSVKDLQAVFGFTTSQAIYKWEQGRALPSIDNLVVLADVLKVRIDDILIIERRHNDEFTNTNATA